jgi:hypothetical protein
MQIDVRHAISPRNKSEYRLEVKTQHDAQKSGVYISRGNVTFDREFKGPNPLPEKIKN